VHRCAVGRRYVERDKEHSDWWDSARSRALHERFCPTVRRVARLGLFSGQPPRL